jgi:Spy/CpxP family protein refolding chaperone
MKKTTIIGLSLTLALALMATAALAWGPGRGYGMGPGYGTPAIPNLTAEQSSQIQALRDGFLKEIEPLQKELYAKTSDLRKLWSTPNADPAAIKVKQGEIFGLQTQLQDKATNLRLEIRKLLTPEQQAQIGTYGYGTGFGPGMGKMGRMGRW